MLLKSKFKFMRLTLLGLMCLLFYCGMLYFDLFNKFSLDNIFYNAELLLTIKEQYLVTVLIIFILTYCIFVIFCLPGNLFMKLIAGFLFGPILGSIVSVITYTASSVLAITIIHWLFATTLQRQFRETIIIIKQKTNFDSLTNLISLRFMPLIPFWLYNIVMSITGVNRKKFAIATLIGTLPISIVLAIIGDSLHKVNKIDARNIQKLLYSPELLLPFFMLSILFFSPNIIKYIKKKKIKNK